MDCGLIGQMDANSGWTPLLLYNATSTVGKNIIATIKMRNTLCYPLKMAIFQILR